MGSEEPPAQEINNKPASDIKIPFDPRKVYKPTVHARDIEEYAKEGSASEEPQDQVDDSQPLPTTTPVKEINKTEQLEPTNAIFQEDVIEEPPQDFPNRE